MNHSSVSSKEAALLSLVEDSGLSVLCVSELARIGPWEGSRLHNTLASLLRKGLIRRIKRGSYAMTSDLNEKVLGIATEVVKPSYISFWTALSQHGFTEQQLMQVQLVSTRQVAPLRIGDFGVEIVALKPYRFYGYEKTKGFVIAEPEKALIDSLFRPDLCGGLNEVVKCLKNAWPSLDQDVLVDYALRFKNRALISRAGHLIESLGLELPGSERLLDARSPSLVPLDPKAERVGEYDRKWGVMVNHSIKMEVIG